MFLAKTVVMLKEDLKDLFHAIENAIGDGAASELSAAAHKVSGMLLRISTPELRRRQRENLRRPRSTAISRTRVQLFTRLKSECARLGVSFEGIHVDMNVSSGR